MHFNAEKALMSNFLQNNKGVQRHPAGEIHLPLGINTQVACSGGSDFKTSAKRAPGEVTVWTESESVFPLHIQRPQ